MNEQSREQQLVSAARDGDMDAFEALVHLYEKRVFALTLRMCGNPEDAAEAAQEAFLAAWQGLAFFRGEASFSTWLYRLVSNACVDLLRRDGRRRASAGPSLDDEELNLDVPDPAPSPQDAAELQELREEIDKMNRSGKPSAAALLDPYIDGELSPEETARVREHLHTCDGCRAYVQAALAIRDAFPEAEDTPVPDGFAAGVMAAIRADAAPRKRRRPRWAKTLLPLAACCAVVVLAVSGLPRPGGTAVTDHPESHAEIAAPAEAAVPNVDSVEEDTAATAYATQSDEDTADVPDSTVSEAIAPEADTVAPGTQDQLAPASDSKSSILPRAGSSADVPETAPATFAIQSPGLTLTAEEAGSLLDSYTLISESDGTLVYELTAAEYTALLQQLEQQGLAIAGAATAEEAEADGTILVHVIPG